MSEMKALRYHKGVKLGQLMELMLSLASPSKIIEKKPLEKAEETANRAALASAQAGEEEHSLEVETKMKCPLESQPTIARNEAEGVTAASKLNLTQPGGGGTQGEEGGANLAFQAAEK